MKKGKILSALTSLAMASTMIMGAVPFTASAATCPTGLELSSPKTEYSVNEIKQGATATVHVDVTSELTSADIVNIIQFSLKPREGWGTVDPVNLHFDNVNALKNDNGCCFEWEEMATDTTAASFWTKSHDDVYHTVVDYNEADPGGDYTDGNMPTGILMSLSSLGYLQTGGDGEHMATFEVDFPTDLEEGTYTIDLVNCKVFVNTSGKPGQNDPIDVTDAGSITFTIGDGEQTTASTAATTVTTANTEPVGSKNYDGDCVVSAPVKVTTKEDGKVYMPVYLDTNGETIEGFGFSVAYDSSVLTLTEFQNSKKAGYAGLAFTGASMKPNPSKNTVIFSLSSLNPITVNAANPTCVLVFEVAEGAANGEYEVKLQNQDLTNPTKPIEVVHSTTNATWLMPTVKQGSVLIGDTVTTASTAATSTTTKSTVASKNYDGDCVVSAPEKVTTKEDGKVYMPVYLDTNGETIEGFGFSVAYDTSVLTLTEFQNSKKAGYPGLAFTGASMKPNPGKNTVIFSLSSLDPITVNAANPTCVLVFEVAEGAAAGEYDVELRNQDLTDPTKPIEVVHNTSNSTWLMPTVKNGSVLIEGDVTTASTAATTAGTTVTTKATAATSSTAATAATSETKATSVTSATATTATTKATEATLVTSPTATTATTAATSKTLATAPTALTSGTLATAETSATAATAQTAVTSTTKATLATLATSPTATTAATAATVPTAATLPTAATVPTAATLPTAPVTTASTVATSATTKSTADEPGADLVIDLSGLTVEGNDSDWYFADETAWHLEGVLVDGKEVSSDKLTFTVDGKEVTPNSLYDSKNKQFDYTITVTYTNEAGQSASAEFTAKIGLRGDANLDHKVAVNDAALIARDRAQLYSTNKTTLKEFGVFLANSEYVYGTDKGVVAADKVASNPYGKYNVTVADAAAIAKYLSKVYSNPKLQLVDLVVKK